MIKKVILGVLTAILCVLSIMLFRQINSLPPPSATGELDKAELQRLSPPFLTKSSSAPSTPSAAPAGKPITAGPPATESVSRKDVASPSFKVAERVQQIEQQALGEAPPTPPVSPPPAQAPQPPVQPATPVAEETRAPQGRHNALKELSVQIVGRDAHLLFVTEKQLERYTYFVAKNPGRVVVDLYGKFEKAKAVGKTPSNNLVGAIRTGIHADRMRIVADLEPNATPVVQVTQRSPTELLVELKGK
jgi:hypothetical protein